MKYAADALANKVDAFLSGVGSREELRKALMEYWDSKPAVPEIAWSRDD